MKDAKVLGPDDIKEMLAEKFSVPVKNIIKTQYSYTVITDDDEKSESGLLTED